MLLICPSPYPFTLSSLEGSHDAQQGFMLLEARLYTYIIWNSPWEICLLSPFYLWVQSFIYVRIDLWIFILYFRLQSNNSVFCCSHCSRFGLWKLFHLAPVSICPLILFVLFPSFSSFICLHFFLYYKMLLAHLVYFLKLIISPRRMAGASLNLSKLLCD